MRSPSARSSFEVTVPASGWRSAAATSRSSQSGSGTALFVCGTCFDPRARITSLHFVLDGEEQPVAAYGMPRLDVTRVLEQPNGYRSGFWGIVQIAPRTPGTTLDLRLRADTDDGR